MTKKQLINRRQTILKYIDQWQTIVDKARDRIKGWSKKLDKIDKQLTGGKYDK